MAFTYQWSELINALGAYVKGLPLNRIDAVICDFISQEMYQEYPWKETIANTAQGTIPLIDREQDLPCSAPNIDRPLKAWLERTDVTPHENRDLDIVKDLSVDVLPKSWYSIRAVSLQQAIGKFRLDSAVQLPEGARIELHVDYQINPIKISDLSQIVWFDDRSAHVAFKGLLYWGYKLNDDGRAGGVQTDASGKVIGYSGQLGEYHAALHKMKEAADFGHADFVFPGEPMGLGRNANALNIFGQ